MDVPCCQDFRSRQEALRNAAAAVGWGRGGFVWPPHPSPGEISMPWILPRLQALFYALRGCSIRDWRTAEPWLCFVEKENKATGYISAYYNVAGQDKANYTSPTRHHGEIHCAILIIFFFALWWIKDSLVFFFCFFLFLSLEEEPVEKPQYISGRCSLLFHADSPFLEHLLTTG